MVDAGIYADLAVDAAIFAAAAWLGLRFTGRVRATRLWFPVTVLFGSVAIFGGAGALSRLADISGNMLLSGQLMVVTGVATGLSIPALFQFFVSYPRALAARWVRSLVACLYFLGITYAVLLPTQLMYSYPAGGAPVSNGPLFQPLTDTLTVALLVGTAWTGFLALRGRTEVERKVGLALTLTVLVPLGVYGGFMASGASSIGGVGAVDVYFLIFMASMSFVLYTRALEPPIPSTFRTLVDSVDEGVIVVDGGGRVSSANRAARALLGIGDAPSGQEMVGAFFERASGSRDTGAFVERTLMGVQRGRIETHEGMLEHIGPRALTLRWRVFPLGHRDASGEAGGALLMLRDETQRHALEKSTEQSRDILDLVIRMLGHDLKAPLTVAMGYIELDKARLQGGSDPQAAAAVRADLDKMSEVLVGMQIMMGNARALSRLAAVGDDAPAPLELDLSKVVRQTVDLLKPLAASRHIALEVSVSDGVTVAVVPGFDSVPRNLVDNAIKYTPPGGAIQVSLAQKDGAVVFTVEDTGTGIPPEKADRLFRKFERLGAEKGSQEGQGLGLSIVAKLVELSKGKVTAGDREDGKSGAVFRVELPAVARTK